VNNADNGFVWTWKFKYLCIHLEIQQIRVRSMSVEIFVRSKLSIDAAKKFATTWKFNKLGAKYL